VHTPQLERCHSSGRISPASVTDRSIPRGAGYRTHSEASTAKGLEALCSLVQRLRSDPALVADVASRVRLPRLLRLLSARSLQRQTLALRRGLQLVGSLADCPEVQAQLVDARALEVRGRGPPQPQRR
jgi:hypothetical protein